MSRAVSDGASRGAAEQRAVESEAGLWPIGRTLTIAISVAVLGLATVMVIVLAVLGFPQLAPTGALPPSQLLEVLKLVLGTVAGTGALFALVMAYRRQRLAEVADERDERRAREDLARVFNERFATAAGQLGHDGAAVRLAGAHALAGLADDWAPLRQTCIDVLCAYLQLPYEPDPGPDAPSEQKLAFARDQRVRHTVIDVIVARLRDGAGVSWQGHTFDFSDAVFDGGNFSGARFTDGDVNFSGTKFTGGRVSFDRVEFSGAIVGFLGAEFSGGLVKFLDTTFSGGTVAFYDARFSGGTVTFRGADFSGSEVSFRGAEFSGGTVDLSRPGGWQVPPDFGEMDPAAPPVGVSLPPAMVDQGETRTEPRTCPQPEPT
ncbi:pentapeptide repeat-containing protein [Nonomuraea sp. LPB2021202275-12-8]|uniref:pentapeptide repeat-containing protein n=1 Tax=Nonomuraea sp. LPB2021202275-12-8 TaxID=3120159 RepID=UPI00300C2B63